MRSLGAACVIILFSVISCTKPLSCDAPPLEIRKCIDRWHQVSDRAMFLKCYPFSGPEHFKGVWAFGFETNIYVDGESPTTKLIEEKLGDTELVMDREPVGPFPAGFARTFAIEFVGRRSLCEMGFPHHYIVVDRVISQREVDLP